MGLLFLNSFITLFVSLIQKQNSSQLHRTYVDKYKWLSLVLFTYIGVNLSGVHGDLCLENNWMLCAGWMFSTLNSTSYGYSISKIWRSRNVKCVDWMFKAEVSVLSLISIFGLSWHCNEISCEKEIKNALWLWILRMR